MDNQMKSRMSKFGNSLTSKDQELNLLVDDKDNGIDERDEDDEDQDDIDMEGELDE